MKQSLGPYIIKEKFSSLCYLVKSLSDEKETKVHVSRLKEFHFEDNRDELKIESNDLTQTEYELQVNPTMTQERPDEDEQFDANSCYGPVDEDMNLSLGLSDLSAEVVDESDA